MVRQFNQDDYFGEEGMPEHAPKSGTGFGIKACEKTKRLSISSLN